MTREQILAKIDEIETAKFMLDMCDRWSSEDYELNSKYAKELRELRALLKANGWEE